jgi:2-polyprenyl-3-methyl-5-hydroxy-6-metoxy-1,4-benzoquinol methylase
MKALSDKNILACWEKNIAQWTKAVQEKQIESRNLVTDQEIIKAVSSLTAGKVIDIGCGEGWLVRELISRGLSVTGIDAVAGLVEKAKEHKGGTFHVLEYEHISSNTINEKYDVAVCNFSLIGKESVEHIFKVIPEMLTSGGKLIIQTLHPHTSCGDAPYADGWREGTWEGFSKEFVDPSPWYFRTLETWSELYLINGLNIDMIKEPIDPHTGKAASLLMVGSATS